MEMRAKGAGAAPRYTVLYDGDCRVCRRSIAFLRRWDRPRTLELLAFQSQEARERFGWIPEEDLERSMQVVEAGPARRRWQGARAFEALLRLLPRGRLFSWLFRIPLVRPLADRIYRLFARHRMRFGCGEHCALPARAAPEKTAGRG